MALERRGNNFYYYGKEREGGRVVSRYYGKGDLASLISQMDETGRDRKECLTFERSENLRKLEEIDLELVEIERNVKTLTECYLTGKGFYKTTSREWRIKANRNNDLQKKKIGEELLAAINQPNPSEADKQALQELFEERPELWQQTADLAAKIEDQIIRNGCSNSHGAQKAFRKKLAAMRDNLGWATASKIEKILIEQVCLNWLRLNVPESLHLSKTTENHNTETGLYWDKRLTTAQKRYLRVCESLAKVRKLTAEADLRGQQARNRRSKGMTIADQVRKALAS